MELFHKQLGFDRGHPFVKTNADEEPFLEEYFVPPPFFQAVLGDPVNPSAAVVLAPRGAGKSAQRRRLEIWCEKNGVLAVTYDRFEFSANQKISDVSLTYHLRNIITRFLVAYLSFLQEKVDSLDKLSKEERRYLSMFVTTYLGDLTSTSLHEILRELKGIPDRLKELWQKNVGVLEGVVNAVLKNYGLEAIDLPDLPQEQKKLSESYKHQLIVLCELARKIGLSAVYVLIDKVDETEKTGNNSDLSYRLVRPLLQDLDLLSLKGIGFKFFLWDAVQEMFRKDARPDRVPQFQINWTIPQLREALSKRMQAFSGGKVKAFSDVVDDSVKFDPDLVISILANGSPRNMIRMCESIVAAQAEVDPGATKISSEAIDQGARRFCEQVVVEQYGAEIVKDLQRVGRELFTINFLSNDVFKTTHENTSRNKVTAWTRCGVVRQIGEVSTSEAKRPMNFYCVVDPAMVRAIHAGVSIEKLLSDRWIPCTHCTHNNLMDIGLFPDKNDPVCCKCGRALV